MASRTPRTAGSSRTPSEARSEPTIIPPTPQLPEGEIEPGLKDIYQLLQHLNVKVTKLQETLVSLENVVLDQDGAITTIKNTVERVSTTCDEITSEVHTLHPTTPETTTTRPDVDPTPKPGPACPTVRITTGTPRKSRSPETKPLLGSRHSDPAYGLFRPPRSPSPTSPTTQLSTI
ncbi:hypothetical protein V565_302780, partial [Rhizoctonia solani 123E]